MSEMMTADINPAKVRYVILLFVSDYNIVIRIKYKRQHC